MAGRRTESRSVDVIYGIHPVIETILAGRRVVEEVWVSRSLPGRYQKILDDSGQKIRLTDNNQIQSLSGSDHHQGIAAKVGRFPYMDISDLDFSRNEWEPTIVMLDEIQDPANLGNIIRISECFGVSAIILPKDRCVTVTASVEKASAGASAHLPIIKVTNLVRAIEDLKKLGFWIYAASAEAKDSYFETDLSGKIVFVLGSEGQGIRKLVNSHCDYVVSIPMQGKVDSLSVSQACAVLISEASRQKHNQLKRP